MFTARYGCAFWHYSFRRLPYGDFRVCIAQLGHRHQSTQQSEKRRNNRQMLSLVCFLGRHESHWSLANGVLTKIRGFLTSAIPCFNLSCKIRMGKKGYVSFFIWYISGAKASLKSVISSIGLTLLKSWCQKKLIFFWHHISKTWKLSRLAESSEGLLTVWRDTYGLVFSTRCDPVSQSCHPVTPM